MSRLHPERTPLRPAELVRRRLVPLVPNAIGKCEACGATLVPDPLEHQCWPTAAMEDRSYQGAKEPRNDR